MYPLKMRPVVKETIWGGKKLKETYNKVYSFEKAGESWEVSSHKSCHSYIANGPLEGMSFVDAVSKYPEICGQSDYDFPLMFKIIDADNDLSIQVHPDDKYASEHENSLRGKTEMWYIIDCDEGSRIGYGFNQELTDEQIKNAIDNGTLEKYIRYIEVKKGEAYFIPAGTVHCICNGLLIGELQQCSDVTYRLYDYNRVDDNGQLRELHIDKAFDVMNTGVFPPVVSSDDGEVFKTLVKCDKFTCSKVNCESEWSDSTNDGYLILFFTDGCGKIRYDDKYEDFKPGDTFVIPASLGSFSISGTCSFLRCHE